MWYGSVWNIYLLKFVQLLGFPFARYVGVNSLSTDCPPTPLTNQTIKIVCPKVNLSPNHRQPQTTSTPYFTTTTTSPRQDSACPCQHDPSTLNQHARANTNNSTMLGCTQHSCATNVPTPPTQTLTMCIYEHLLTPPAHSPSTIHICTCFLVTEVTTQPLAFAVIYPQLVT